MRVLVADADDLAAERLAGQLSKQGYEVRRVGLAEAALAAYEEAELVLLDLDLPDLDGIEVCRRMRARGRTPIIGITASTDELDRVLSLQAGADDCVVKPCGLRELLARIGAVTRRLRHRTPAPSTVSRGPLEIDPLSRRVWLDSKAVETTRKEFDLLYELASAPENVLSRKELMSRVWSDDWGVASRTVDTHVSSLRGKLGDGGWIVTVRGVGYRLGRGGDLTKT